MTETNTPVPGPEGARVGVWFVGARGSVGATAIAGALAVRAGLAGETGMVSRLPEVAVAGLPELAGLQFGGHDVSDVSLPKRVEALVDAGVVPHGLPAALATELARVDARIRPGVTGSERPQREIAAALTADLRAFREDNGLDRVVVVDVSSTEPPVRVTPELLTLDGLEQALDAGESPLPASSLYAYAALRADCSVVAFTPSPGPRLPALAELAETVGLPWAGSDGKTGETLLKTVLAPMFAMRALKVRSWSSMNLLGGGDGRTLADPANAVSKTATKGQGLEAILGHRVDGPLHIDYVPDLGDWKTAWDMVSFEGFLGARMSLQFTWTGCDSALAAPLVLDLARLVARAHQAGRVGPQAALGFFFKDPAGSDVHALSEQWEALRTWCAELAEAEERR
ncbi:inositol-3-phosphate synthase [Phytoactinopolyspora halotolerans]|uniref:Myo-inositol-1-phosphate synthase n=1 Tax=Phytoactinopolyspora halotolerans TaxID=1981512 RepID=A0A6L9SHD9_9ACTN|nr:inositol-3-phosphate synthase [Phytoactinopolyspora halotolerans]NEE03510.1 myo-inositol-1-phosphate synthase [Phytoactinopolyspora halotolerans]